MAHLKRANIFSATPIFLSATPNFRIFGLALRILCRQDVAQGNVGVALRKFRSRSGVALRI